MTDRVNAAVKPGMDDAAAAIARRGAMATIEKESHDKTGLRSDVVTLYQGGQYHLYTFKKYTDVRLVFAPEFDIAFFGGDPDNFEYPRYDLDVCFFRAYEDGKPARPEHYLKWSPAGSKEGDLVFVAGHPGRTSRLNTLAHLEYLRDVSFPFTLDLLHDREAFLLEYGKRGPEQARQSKEDLFGYPELAARPATGGLEGLRDPALMARKRRRRERASATGSTPTPPRRPPTATPGTRSPRRRRSRREIRHAATTSSSAGSPSTRTCSRSPGPSSGWPRRRPSRTPTGSASTATRRSSRSSSSSSPTRRSTPNTRRPSSPTRSPSGRS